MDRGRKRPEVADQLPADKRACSSSEFRPTTADAVAAVSSSSTSSVPPPSSSEHHDCDMESSSSGRGGGDSAYGSCESDDDLHHHQPPAVCGASRGRFQRIISVLDSEDAGPSAQLASLTELCEALSFCMEDSLGYFPMDNALPLLVRLAGSEGNPDVMLLAIRAITYLCDVMPRAADAIVRHGALSVLCGRLLSIEYLDVAEQSLQALEKISRKQPVPCLQAGTIMAVLGFMDFFSTSVQRVALSTVANVCKKLPLDCSSLVLEAVPTLCNLLQYEDCKLVETAVTCLMRITSCFSSSTEILDVLCKHGVISKSLHLITVDGRTTLSQSAFVGLIGLLANLANASLVAVRTLFELGVSSSLKRILIASGISHGTSYSYPDGVYSNQVHEVLKLLNHMMPSAARDDENIQLVMAKEMILEEKPMFLHQFSADILPVLIEVVKSGANLCVCYGCLSVMINIIYFSTVDMLQDLVKNSNISSFLAGLMARKDRHVLVSALKIVELLMQKFSCVCSSSFIKEGVVYAIEVLLEHENRLESVGLRLDQQDNQIALRDVPRCLCYVFDPPNTSTSERKACRLGKDAVFSLAKHIKATYFTGESVNCEIGVSEVLKKLKIMCATLNETVDQSSFNDGCAKTEELSQLLGQVMAEINLGEAISSFEFVESGIIRSLVHYLSNGRYLNKSYSDCMSTSHWLAILKRLQIFTGISLSKDCQNWEDMLLTLLVRKLLDALTSFDNFPVIVSQFFKSRSSYSDIPSRHSTLHPCLRVRFVREDGELNLSDYSDVVSIEVSSSFVAIEGFLWPKVGASMSGQLQEQKGKDVTTTSIAVSSVRCPEVLINQEQQASLEDTSMKLREMMTESSSDPHSSSEGHAKGSESSFPSNKDATPKLIFSMEGREVDRSLTLYQAILQFQINAEPDLVVGPKFWNEVYKVSYRKASQNTTHRQEACCDSPSLIFQEKAGYPWHKLSFISSIFLAELPCKLDKSNPSYELLFMMKILEGLNRFSSYLLSYERCTSLAEGRIENLDDLKVVVPSIPQAEFISCKLTDKLEQQLQDPLTLATGCMPAWCGQLMMACPFLFSFEARWKYFRFTTFGCKGQLNQIQPANISGSSSVIDRRSASVWSYRKKIKVTRSDILGSAAKMMASHAQSRAVIEVEYEEEVGTGLGPTMEFFTLVSHEFQKAGMGMWRGDKSSFNVSQTSQCSDESAFVVAPFGLFPCPWAAAACASDDRQFSDVIKKFTLLGQLVAKAIRDGRILDIPFCSAFYKVILDQELGIYDIQSFDPELGRTLLEFQALSYRKRFLESASTENFEYASDLCFRSTAIEDLCLDFTLPGYSDYVLSSATNSEMLNIHNLEEYVSLVVDATIKDGISRQVQAFRSGFNEVFPLKSLQIFTEDELERVLCGEQETWTFSELLDHVKFDHGYTASSPPVINLLETIQEFECNERRAFLQFVTGAPRLPPGGLAALNPKLTIVRKLCSYEVDMDLPSVMTCANYLKLPPYSSKEITRERLLYAITEGQGSFHLS
ncbi:E3 ubiquitin-protein ligase UPL4 [Dendrobium catenatum]|uniref:HECT-type E3 ubiquitin transferase n=1 Tax=Dendrobium catenatum TaxID=906689 RepID=A0A2I0VLP5_9ASPA|nr:E3 ubiquitin-protein ligase UPL4 [Dendrobium catenatum]XP_020690783.1 E3 ubiquitin-protein ligase UPL4 [Dendrobium catenatum]PKU64336.1 E3 ubiquitin-protein ligase UPL4 [Dendrobium catenatum]